MLKDFILKGQICSACAACEQDTAWVAWLLFGWCPTWVLLQMFKLYQVDPWRPVFNCGTSEKHFLFIWGKFYSWSLKPVRASLKSSLKSCRSSPTQGTSICKHVESQQWGLLSLWMLTTKMTLHLNISLSKPAWCWYHLLVQNEISQIV